MAIITTDSQHYNDIADAIRGKNGTQNTYLPSEMAAAITNLPSGGGNPEGTLPSEYQQVEYIDGSESGAVIDTGIQPTQDTWAKIKLNPLVITGDCLFGTKGASDNMDWRLFNHNGVVYFDYKNIRVTGCSLPVGTAKELYLHTIEQVGEFSIPYDIFINGWTASNTSKAEWYYVKIYEGDEMLRSFVPCYRIADNVVGMFDLVTQTFYTSAGSGSFTAGADVLEYGGVLNAK